MCYVYREQCGNKLFGRFVVMLLMVEQNKKDDDLFFFSRRSENLSYFYRFSVKFHIDKTYQERVKYHIG